jgi:hypothetical protein
MDVSQSNIIPRACGWREPRSGAGFWLDFAGLLTRFVHALLFVVASI